MPEMCEINYAFGDSVKSTKLLSSLQIEIPSKTLPLLASLSHYKHKGSLSHKLMYGINYYLSDNIARAGEILHHRDPIFQDPHTEQLLELGPELARHGAV